MPDREAPPKGALGRLVHGRGQRGKLRIRGTGRAFRQRRPETLQEGLAHLEVAPRVGAIERFVAKREIGHDVALDCGFEKRPLEPRGVAQVAARHHAVVCEPHMREDIAAKSLDEREALASASEWRECGADRAAGQAREHRLDQIEAFADLFNPNPYAGVYVASAPDRNLETESVVRRIGTVAARVEVTARRAADYAPGAEPARQIRFQHAGPDRAVLQRSGVVIELDEAWKRRANVADKRANRLRSLRSQINGDAARKDRVHHQPMAESGLGRAQRPLAQDPA